MAATALLLGVLLIASAVAISDTATAASTHWVRAAPTLPGYSGTVPAVGAERPHSVGAAGSLVRRLGARSDYVQVTGTITDYVTGEPIEGATIIPLGSGENWGMSYTDQDGKFVRYLPPDSYIIEVWADGYYDQVIGEPLALNQGGEVPVRAEGPNILDQKMLPDTLPWAGITSGSISWAHRKDAFFDSMILDMRFGSYAVVPDGWGDDAVELEVRDARGRVIESSSETVSGGIGGIGIFSSGTADGCGYYSSGELPVKRPDLRRATISVRLASDPSVKSTQPMDIDFGSCRQTRVHTWIDRGQRPTDVRLGVSVEDRYPDRQGVKGTINIVGAAGRPVTFPVVTGRNGGERAIGRLLHGGQNRVTVIFEPSDTAMAAGSSKSVRIKVGR